MFKVVLLEPEFDLPFKRLLNEGRTYAVPPLWAICLGTFLKREVKKIDLTILDCRIFPVRKLTDWARKHRPDIAGISPKFLTYQSAVEAAKIFKKFGAKVVLGGMHASALAREILTNRGPASSDYCVDAIIKEDGEKAFYEYAVGKPSAGINNLVWLDGAKIRENKIKLLDLNSLPRGDRDLVDTGKYLKRTNIFTIMSQKGCAWREKSGGCVFCAQGLSGLRFRDPGKVWEEIYFLRKKYNVGIIWDSSENFLNNLDWIKEFRDVSRSFKNKPQFKIFMRLEQVNDEVAKILSEINVKEAILGVESGSRQSLAAFRKGITPDAIKKKIRLLHKYNVKTFHCYVFGAPGESVGTMKETLKFAKFLAKTPGHIGSRFNTLIPFPGSPAWEMLIQKTNGKYVGQDLIDWREVTRDWVAVFCRIDGASFWRIYQEARGFANKINSVRNTRDF